MGVRGLETFVEKIIPFPSNCCNTVSIQQLVADFRKKRGDDVKPIIAFHMSNYSRPLLENIDYVCGGQHNEALGRMRKFVNAFKNLGVRPVLFFRGYSEEDKDNFDRSVWIKKGLARLERVHELYQSVGNGGPIPNEDPSSNVPYLGMLSYYYSTMFDCEVYKAIRECNQEIVQYARTNEDCIAIFAQDSDFIIQNAAPYYLSANHFDIGTMTTRNYSTRGLAEELRLEQRQLPLFAVLAGLNQFITSDELEPFHRDLTRGRNGIKSRFRTLADYIRYTCRGGQEPYTDFIRGRLPQIAAKLTASRVQLREGVDCQTLLCLGVENFDANRDIPPPAQHPDPEWRQILEKATDLHIADVFPTTIRKILNNQPFEYLAPLEDLHPDSTCNLTSSATVTRPIRSRIYGILLFEKPDRPNSVTEYCFEGPNGNNEPIQVEISLPQDQHPGLLQLWCDDRSDAMQQQRWKLFAHAISSHLDQEKLETLPEDLILSVATLFYLKEHNTQTTEENDLDRLKDWEFNALIAMVVLMENNLNEREPTRIVPRAVYMASVFNRTLFTIMDLLAVCGYPLSFERTFAHPYINGKLLQRKYQEAESGATDQDLCENEANAIARFNTVKVIVFRNP